MSNVLAHRIYDFLKDHPPFNFIDKNNLIEISSKIKVLYFEKDKIIFEQGEKPSDSFYVVREGAVELFENYRSKKILIDVCDEGDIFGIRPLVSNNENYTLTGLVAEETLVYSIPVSLFTNIISQNQKIKDFFSSCFAEGMRNTYIKYSRYKAIAPAENHGMLQTNISEVQLVDNNKNIITCLPEESIKNAAQIMRDKNVGSIIIVNEKLHPVGIFTDRDLRNKVATGEHNIDEPIGNIMSSPVITAKRTLSVADIQIKMIKENIHHLCITEDGTNNSKVQSVVSEHDVLVNYSNSPSVLIREIQRSKSVGELQNITGNKNELLKKYLRQEVSIEYISKIISEINSAVNIKAIELSINELNKDWKNIPDVKWCWLALGSQGRQEQLVNSDQDNALVFEDVDGEKYHHTKEYFVELARKVNAILRDCGFEYCPAEMMAGNPKWCLSLNEWIKQFDTWIYAHSPKDVMYTTIFFDFSNVYGDETLAGKLRESILDSIKKNESFLMFLANNALQNPPPLSFFRNIMIENNGEHKDEFDIKARAMMPLIDGARVLTIASGRLDVISTIERFKTLGELEPENKELFELLADEFELLIRLKTLQGIKHNNSGRYIKPDELNKMQRLLLTKSFAPIKDLQTLLTVRFRLNLMK